MKILKILMFCTQGIVNDKGTMKMKNSYLMNNEVIKKQIIKKGHALIDVETYNKFSEYFENCFDFKEVREMQLTFTNFWIERIKKHHARYLNGEVSIEDYLFQNILKTDKKYFTELYKLEKLEQYENIKMEEIKFKLSFKVYVPNFMDEQEFNGLMEVKDFLEYNDYFYSIQQVVLFYNNWQEDSEDDGFQMPFSYWWDLSPERGSDILTKTSKIDILKSYYK